MAWRGGKDSAFGFWRKGFPIDPRERALSGHQPPDGNLGHDSAPWGSMEIEESLETAAALEYAQTGNESDGTIAAPAGGHEHDEGVDTYLGWLQLLSVRTWTGIGSSGSTRGAYLVDSATDVPVALFAFLLPPGITHVVPRAYVGRTAGTSGIVVTFQYYAPANLNAASPDVHGASVCVATPYSDDTLIYLEGGASDLSGIALTNGKRIVYCRVDARVAGAAQGLYEIQLAPLASGARVTAKAELDTTLATPDVTLTGTTLATVYKDNVANLLKLAYGTTRPLPRILTPHDHGAGGGEILERSLLSVVYGPHAREGVATAGGTIGVPLLPPASGVSFATSAATAKLVAQHPIFVPGGVESIGVYVACSLPGAGTRTVDLTVEVRPPTEHGYDSDGRSAVSEDFAFSATGTSDFQTETASFNLQTLGGVNEDRVFEVVVWLRSDPPGASAYRLVSFESFPGTAPTHLPDQTYGQARDELPVAKLKEGQEVNALLTRRAQLGYNQVSYAVLGAAPGLERDLRTPKTDDPWRRLLTAPHNHRGVEFTDEATGDRVNDGAVLRTATATFYGSRLDGETTSTEGTDSTIDPVLGQKLTPGGTFSAGARFTQRVSVPRGLGALDLYLCVQPGTSAPVSRLWLLAYVFEITGPDTFGDTILTRVSCGPFSATPSFSDGVGGVVCQVSAAEGVLWVRSPKRLMAGQGVWTLDALRQTAALPTGARATHPARWSLPITLEISPARTVDCVVFLGLGLQTGAEAVPTGGTYDDEARLLSLLIVPSAGY